MRQQSNKLWATVALVMVFVLLSACGKSNSSPLASESASPSQTAVESPSGASEEASTRVYKDSTGREVTIPTHPQRVITSQYLPQMLAAGLKPIGAATHLLNNFTAVKDQLTGIEDVGQANEMNLEKALTLNPDLIIATEWNEDKLDQLSKIAPTVIVKWEGKDPFQHFTDVADILGRSDEAQQWIQAYDKKGEEARAKLKDYVKEGETFGVVVIGGYEKGQLRVYGTGNVGYTLFQTLQFPMTDFVKTEWNKGDNNQGLAISLEKLPEYASADRLFVVKFDNDPEFLKQVEDSRLWSDLPAVKNNKVYVVDASLWFSYDIMSFEAQLNDAVRMLAK
ncbi:ABC transporter substrate-binding protein [Cohnella abietis]|uniref:ABC transporter substrate-binding protein n=1 Tax=Cohnella abietis TaxID=2507935 RepID=UPI0013004919|nr:ABC transporter substrate-binding protein [Cohnella abietis]